MLSGSVVLCKLPTCEMGLDTGDNAVAAATTEAAPVYDDAGVHQVFERHGVKQVLQQLAQLSLRYLSATVCCTANNRTPSAVARLAAAAANRLLSVASMCVLGIVVGVVRQHVSLGIRSSNSSTVSTWISGCG